MRLLILILMSLLPLATMAQTGQPKEIATSQQFGKYTVHYNVFNSTSIPPKVTQAYGLVRGKDRALINVSLTKTENGNTTLGLPAQVSIISRNLMQQQQPLRVIDIKEGDATYYLAPFVFTNEELLHFELTVKSDAEEKPFVVTFNRTLYTEK